MFNKMKNIDAALRYIKNISLVVIIGTFTLCGFIVAKGYRSLENSKEKLYVLVNGKALEAYASDRKDNIPVEARDHIKMFHFYFFTLSPDDKAIDQTISKALYLADQSAKKQYDDLKESNFFSNIISANVNQTISVDSIALDMNSYPIPFECHAIQTLTRPTSTVIRSLITRGYLRNVGRSENNPHGFLIEKWSILENKDLKVTQR